MAGDPDCRTRKVMYEVLSKPAQYREVLRIRHFVCDCGVRRTTPKALFMLKRNTVWLSEAIIRSPACEWRIDCDCRRDCVLLMFEPTTHFARRYSGVLYNFICLLTFRSYTWIIVIRSTLVIFMI